MTFRKGVAPRGFGRVLKAARQVTFSGEGGIYTFQTAGWCKALSQRPNLWVQHPGSGTLDCQRWLADESHLDGRRKWVWSHDSPNDVEYYFFGTWFSKIDCPVIILIQERQDAASFLLLLALDSWVVCANSRQSLQSKQEPSKTRRSGPETRKSLILIAFGRCCRRFREIHKQASVSHSVLCNKFTPQPSLS